MEDWPINIVDLGVAGVVLVSALFAFYRGFVRETLAIAGWVGAFFATVYLLPYARPYAERSLGESEIAGLVAAVGLFLVALIVLWLITHAIVVRVRASPLSALDRSLGFLFGIARALVILALAYMAASQALWREKPPELVTEARSQPLIDYSAALIVSLVPEGTFNLPAEGFERIQRQAEELERLKALQEQAIELKVQRLSEPPVAPAEVRGAAEEPAYDAADTREMERLQRSLIGEPAGSEP